MTFRQSATVQFITNACVIISFDELSILCDPWLTDGAFEGSWYHDPPLRTRPADLHGITHIYISHIHPDHFDPATLKQLPRVPVILLDSSQPWLQRHVERLGFPTLLIRDGEHAQIGDANVWMFSAFTTNPLTPSDVPNVLDSAVVLENGVWSVLNANDNTPDAAACKRLVGQFGTFDLALLPYSGASEYPSCFTNLDDDHRQQAARSKSDRYLTRLEENVRSLHPRRVLPFAGQYRLAGRLAAKNPALGIPSIDEAHARVRVAGAEPVELDEGDSVDVLAGNITRATSEPAPMVELSAYWYETAFDFPTPSHRTDLLPLLKAARSTLWRYQQQFDWHEPHRVLIEIDGGPGPYVFDFATETVDAVPCGFVPDPPYLRISASYGLLLALLTRHLVFNNAAIGCHFDFYREPDVYVPEVWTLLSFLHI